MIIDRDKHPYISTLEMMEFYESLSDLEKDCLGEIIRRDKGFDEVIDDQISDIESDLDDVIDSVEQAIKKLKIIKDSNL